MNKITFTICILLICVTNSFSQKKEFNFSGFSEKADSYMKAVNSVGEFSGTILVAYQGEIKFHRGYGLASKRFNIPNSASTKFRIGSVTKSFTAISILQLVEQGKLALNDPLSKYIPDYPFADQIKIENLLSHTSGIRRDIKFADRTKTYKLEELITMSKIDSLLYKPGTKMSYSNCGYILLHYILEKLTGEKYENYVTKNVLQPLGLFNTGIEDPLSPPEGLADGFRNGEDKDGYFTYSEVHMSSHGYSDAVGAMYSTTEDLLKFCRQIGKSDILKQETWKLALQPFIKDAAPGYRWGFGFNIIEGKTVKVINHNGRTTGFRGGYFQFMEDDITVIILGNHMDAARGTILKAFQGMLLDRAYYQPKTHESIGSDDIAINDYVGNYKTEDFPFKISEFKNHLYVESHGDVPSRLVLYEKDAFFCKYFDLTLKFKRKKGKIIGCEWIYKNKPEQAVKL